MNNFLIPLFLLLFLNFYSQSTFEGRLTYYVKNEYLGNEEKRNNFKKLIEDATIPSDSIIVFYSKRGDVLSMYKKEDAYYLEKYNPKTNYLYFINPYILNFITAIDVRYDLEETLGSKPMIKLLEEKEYIGDIECSIVEVQWKTGKYRYFFSKDYLKINPEIYINYNYDQWYNYLSISKSLPIKIEKVINNFYRTTFVLHSFSEMDIDDSIFNLPKLKKNKTLSKLYINKVVFDVLE